MAVWQELNREPFIGFHLHDDEKACNVIVILRSLLVWRDFAASRFPLMKTAPIVLTLFVGVLIGITATLGFQQWLRARFLRSMPSLAERTARPHIDELPHIRLSKRDGQLHREVYDWLGHRRPDMETMVKLSKSFYGEPPVFALTFEAGVTSDELESTISDLSELGVPNVFLGHTFYGKSVDRWRPPMKPEEIFQNLPR